MKLKITLKPFQLPTDRHYVKVRDNVLKFQSEFCKSDGSLLPSKVPDIINDVIQHDIRNAVIKICTDELHGKKVIKNEHTTIHIGRRPWVTNKTYTTPQRGDAKKHKLNPKEMYVLSLRVKENSFSNAASGDASQTVPRVNRKRKHGESPNDNTNGKKTSCVIS